MGTERDIASVSIPFVAAVAIYAAVPFGTDGTMITSLVSGIAVAALMAATVVARRRITLMALFFSLGAMCASASDLLPSASPPADGNGALRALERLIDGIPFEDSLTSGLAKALFCGDRSGLPWKVASSFRKAGAAHMLALSGLHLGIIAGAEKKALSVLGNSPAAAKTRSCIVVASAVAYTIMCGSGASLVRACIFVCLGETASLKAHRRLSAAGRLAVAATLQLALDPGAVSTVSFQLSYLAMAGITFINPHLEKWYDALSSALDGGASALNGGKARGGGVLMRKIWSSAATCISCQMTTAPLVWLKFGSVPGHFLLANLLCLPLCECFMVCGLLCLGAGAIGLDAGLPAALTERIGALMLRCLEIIATM